jgi:glycosyltransferase involved in cell wall biosynthesis
MPSPLVTVICLCYNQGRYVREAILSVLSQTYDNIELIVVDDASTDHSVQEIRQLINDYPQITFLPQLSNLGNCAAFNKGLEVARGQYVVDFAADDIMMPDRISKQIDYFSGLGTGYGVIFTDAVYIDPEGKPLHYHFDHLKKKKLINHVPQGEIYKDVLRRYFICSPTMIVKREVFDKLGGYDTRLSYEDFDFWVRSAREFKYAYLPEPLTKVRRAAGSMSTRAYKPADRQLRSTYLVCEKALALNRTKEDNEALLDRARYELRQAVFSENTIEAKLFFNLIKQLTTPALPDVLLLLLNRLRLPLSVFRNAYHRIRYR